MTARLRLGRSVREPPSGYSADEMRRGWTLYTTVKNAFEEVSERVGPDRADWLAEWEAVWDDPTYPKP